MTARFLTAVLLIPLVLLSILYLPLPAFLLLLTLVAWQGMRELSGLLQPYGEGIPPLASGWALSLPWLLVYWPGLFFPFLLLAVWTLWGWVLWRSREPARGVVSAATSLLPLFYLSIPLALAASYHPGAPRSLDGREAPLELILVLVTIWAGDSAAFFAGRAFGRRRIVPRLSPGKTLEGFLAGMVASVLVSVLFGSFFLSSRWTRLQLVGVGVALGGAGIGGDLFESLLKRGAQRKDSSGLLPGHGGLLDRIDSLLFALPVYYLATLLIQ